MDQPADPQWLTWTKRLQAIAQTGLTFTVITTIASAMRSCRPSLRR